VENADVISKGGSIGSHEPFDVRKSFSWSADEKNRKEKRIELKKLNSAKQRGHTKERHRVRYREDAKVRDGDVHNVRTIRLQKFQCSERVSEYRGIAIRKPSKETSFV
jgi:hypothetical protein